ncbi:SAM-dependent chlorinase/fluorinase [uncultured Desulfosarcina sp.]|uniref:SAM hydrolase/SAM-dependent halogenase family protein n=1 Tax=uncultured Desulfosarcina sp. TaxID=218289 RepID=UPI0029C60F3D|nr:SAM-dependent chlorinase/fluorinase [uncultured Desulfosarcina sp.]
MPLIALLTDFGTCDEYVGVMKGVVAGIDPDIRVVDICHQIEPQNVVHGAFILQAAVPYFPEGTVFVAVVDPGVGGRRRILAADFGGRRFVVPDNGLIEGALKNPLKADVVSVENRRYFLTPVSRTFHGRDIFAPVAAHLAAGLPLAELGPPVDSADIVAGKMPRYRFSIKDGIQGVVVAADRFGNLMTNIDERAIARLCKGASGRHAIVSLADTTIGAIVDSYDQAVKNAPLAIIGSRGLLEIAVNCGNTRQMLPTGKDRRVRVQLL